MNAVYVNKDVWSCVQIQFSPNKFAGPLQKPSLKSLIRKIKKCVDLSAFYFVILNILLSSIYKSKDRSDI